MVEGVLLFHVDPRGHRPGRDQHALILKLRRLRRLRLGRATIGRIRPIYHVYTTPGHPRPDYHYLVEVTADSQASLTRAFAAIDRIRCHVDGFGF